MKKIIKYIGYVIGIALLFYIAIALAFLYLSPIPSSVTTDYGIPPPKTAEHIRLEKISERRGWTKQELDKLMALRKERDLTWENQPTARQFLSTVEGNKEEAMLNELKHRGLSQEEVKIFMDGLKQDLPDLLN